MTTQKHLAFISSRVMKLGTALFTDFSTSVLKFPVSIITIAKADEAGNIWFNVRKPFSDTSGIDKAFFAQLQFYNKNFDYYVTVQGKAEIITSGTGFTGNAETGNRPALSGELLVKLQIDHATCFFSRKEKTEGNNLKNYKDKFLEWWLNNRKQEALEIQFHV